MPKYELKIYADSVEELLSILRKSEFTSVEENNIDSKFVLPIRKNKQWTQFELNFLTENYLSKNIGWIAGQLKRKKSAVYSMLHIMYKKGLKVKRPKVKNL